MTKKQKSAVKAMAEDALRALNDYRAISISAYNYGLQPTDEVLMELRKYPFASVESEFFGGYVLFKRKAEKA